VTSNKKSFWHIAGLVFEVVAFITIFWGCIYDRNWFALAGWLCAFLSIAGHFVSSERRTGS
jgi:hypothetical protein